MYLISLETEYNYELKKRLENNILKQKITIFTKNDLDNGYLKKANCVITNYDTKTIDYFNGKNNNVIIYDPKANMINTKYKNRRNINICNNPEEIEDILNKIENRRKLKIKRSISLAAIFIILLSIISIVINLDSQKKVTPKEMEEEKIKKQDNKTKEPEIKKDSEEEINIEETPTEEKDVSETVAEELDLKKENIVFFGDSITEYYELDEYYDDKYPIINSGTSGHQTVNLLEEIDTKVVKYNPTKVFILIGTNDIEFTDLTDEELVKNIIKIAKSIKVKRPMTEIYIESIYPVNRSDEDKIQLDMVKSRENERIKKINSLLEEKCNKYNYRYIDMYSILVDNDKDELNLDYTRDGLHINREGYEIITEELLKYINNEK